MRFRDELEALIDEQLEASESLRRVLASASGEARDALTLDDLIYLVADVLGALREAVLRTGEEIDVMRE